MGRFNYFFFFTNSPTVTPLLVDRSVCRSVGRTQPFSCKAMAEAMSSSLSLECWRSTPGTKCFIQGCVRLSVLIALPKVFFRNQKLWGNERATRLRPTGHVHVVLVLERVEGHVANKKGLLFFGLAKSFFRFWSVAGHPSQPPGLVCTNRPDSKLHYHLSRLIEEIVKNKSITICRYFYLK